MLRTSVLLGTITWFFVAALGASALDIGDTAPNFTAQSVDGKEYSLASASKESELVVVCFTCNQCPISVAYEDRLIEFNKQFQDKNVTFIALNCNIKTEDMDAMKERAEEKGFNFVYAFDESGAAAVSYGAKVTPELFVISKDRIAYHGAFDNELNDPTKHYLSDAVSALLAGQSPPVAKTKAFGCGIKLE